ncbi:MAG: tryptophan 7-halogenase, partial [Candidatus Bathyarchaeia archaeon]
VCLLDLNKKEMIGDKVCGDAVGRHHFDALDIQPPKGDELANVVEGIEVYSPDMRTVFRVRGEGLHGFVINRREFGQRLLEEALRSGVELYERTLVTEPIIEGGFVRGVKARDLEEKKRFELRGDVVIDASGLAGTLRRRMPDGWGIEGEIEDEDISVCYREIRQLASPIEGPEHLKIFLSQRASPGGYCWIFPKGDDLANVGMGVQMLGRSQNPKRRLYEHVLSQPLFDNSSVIRAGGGVVTTRRPISCMVGNGILFVGDAACQPSPIHGGGIGPSMVAGRLAAKTACEAIGREDVSREGLWPYNLEFMAWYGAKAASLDVFRIFLQNRDDEALNYGMEYRLIREDDILKASLGEDLKLSITDKAERFLRGIGKLPFLRGLVMMSRNMRAIKSLYKAYPRNFEGLQSWVRGVDRVINDMKEMSF